MDFVLLDKESEDLIKKLNKYKKDYVTVSYNDCTIATINHLIDNDYLKPAFCRSLYRISNLTGAEVLM